MLEINEKEKTVKCYELWNTDCIKYIYESIGVYEIELTDDDFFQILKMAATKAILWGQNLTDSLIENTIDDYMDENYPEN